MRAAAGDGKDGDDKGKAPHVGRAKPVGEKAGGGKVEPVARDDDKKRG